MEETKICEHCGTEVELTDGEYFDGKFHCRCCLDELTIVCEDCGERVWREDAVEDRICQICYDEDYCRCECCGRLRLSILRINSLLSCAYSVERYDIAHLLQHFSLWTSSVMMPLKCQTKNFRP